MIVSAIKALVSFISNTIKALVFAITDAIGAFLSRISGIRFRYGKYTTTVVATFRLTLFL